MKGNITGSMKDKHATYFLKEEIKTALGKNL